ncbi:MAG: hypothetical protein AB7P76_02335 [Candidatus Melainabacteria bacterium]
MVSRIYTPQVLPYPERKPRSQGEPTVDADDRRRSPFQERLPAPDPTQTLSATAALTQSPPPTPPAEPDTTADSFLQTARIHRETGHADPIRIETILQDFHNTLQALGAPEALRAEVTGYLAAAGAQAVQAQPEIPYIKHSLSVAAKTMDRHITQTLGDSLEAPSSVVKDWVDALLLQPIRFQATSPLPRGPESLGDGQSLAEHVTTDNEPTPASRAHTPEQALTESRNAYRAGNISQAITLLQTAADTLSPEAESALSGRIHYRLGLLLAETGDTHQAAHHLSRAAAMLERAGEVERAAKSWQSLGALHFQDGQAADAVTAYQQGYTLASSQPALAHTLPDLLSNLGAAYRLAGHPGNARKAYSLALQAAQSLGQTETLNHVSSQLATLGA